MNGRPKEKPPRPGEAIGGKEISDDQAKVSEATLRRKRSNSRLERMLAGWERFCLYLEEWTR